MADLQKNPHAISDTGVLAMTATRVQTERDHHMSNIQKPQAENNRTDLPARIINHLGGNQRTGMCNCPCHDDETASLHVTVGYKHPVVLKCFAKCPQETLVAWAKWNGFWYTTEQQQAWERKQVEREAKYKAEQKDYHRLKKAYAILRAASYNKVIPPTEYLKGRGIANVPECAALLSAKDAVRLINKRFPAMVVPVIKDDRLVGAQVTLLNKYATAKLATDRPKLSYGPIAGGVPLADVDPKQQLLVGEGIETVLSAMQITGLPGIAALGAANMIHVEVPTCSEVIIVADNDDPGYEAAKLLSRRLANEGRKVRVAYPEFDGEDWNDVLRRDDLDALQEIREAILEAEPGTPSRDVKALGMQDFINLQFPRREYLLKPWLTTTGLAMVDAPAGQGKTWLALSIAYAVAAGKELLGWKGERKARVLYVDGELAGELLQSRLMLLGEALPDSDLRVISHAQFEMRGALMPDLGEAAGRDFLDQIIDDNNVDLIILDSVSTLVRSGVDNDVEGWRAIQTWSLRHRAKGRAIIYLHHQGRSGNPRGTSSREIVLDARIKLERDYEASTDARSSFKLEFPKSRDFWGKDAAPMLIHLATTSGTVEWSHETVRDHTKERIRTLRDQGFKQKAIAKELGLTEARISQIVKQLQEEKDWDDHDDKKTDQTADQRDRTKILKRS